MRLADDRFSREPRGLRSSQVLGREPWEGQGGDWPTFPHYNPLGGFNSNLNGLDVYKTLVLICLWKSAISTLEIPPELCDSYHQKSDLSAQREQSKLLPWQQKVGNMLWTLVSAINNPSLARYQPEKYYREHGEGKTRLAVRTVYISGDCFRSHSQRHFCSN